MTLSRPLPSTTVLLEHRLSAQESHFDWLVAPSGVDSGTEADIRDVATFRTASRIDAIREGEFEAERIQDHRRLYLGHEGPVSGGRGSVRRVASGTLLGTASGEGDHVDWTVDFGGGQRRFVGRRSGGLWVFRVSLIGR